jgi:glycosyltransferase involved in cell wall biosynthesis
MVLLILPLVLLAYASFKSLLGGFSFHRYFRSQLRLPDNHDTPFASVIIPCKGLEAGQRYPAFEIILVTESAEDTATATISKFSADKVRTVIAGRSANEGQKIHNLREAIKSVSDHSEVLVFADSDARPSDGWLSALIAALPEKGVAAATGYRWFLSSTGGFWSELCAVWNASVASRLGADKRSNFCWGGSTAIRREVFENLAISERWRGAVSDDYMMLLALREAGGAVVFVPGAMTASFIDVRFGEFVEFTNRQMKITRVYEKKLWISALIGAVLFDLGILCGIVVIIFGDAVYGPLAAMLLSIVWGCSIGKASLRLKAVAMALPQYASEFKRQRLYQLLLWPITPTAFLINCLVAASSSEIVWRGRRYRMLAPNFTETETAD